MAAHIYQLAINTNVGGQFCSNIMHYGFDDAGYSTTSQAAEALGVAWDAANTGAFRNMISQHTTLLTLRARAIQISGGFEGLLSYAAGTVGLRAGNLMAAGLSACLIFLPVGNAKQRGRMFLPGLSDSDATDGQLTTAFTSNLITRMNTLITPFTLAGGGAPVATPVVYSRILHAGLTIGEGQVSPMIAQVRRRQQPV